MSFFGFEENDLEKEKQRFLQGGTQNTEHLAEFTWGEESYDGLGDALQEGADDLNDETFGSMGDVGENIAFEYLYNPLINTTGKDFDFAATTGRQESHQPVQRLDPLLEDRSAFQEATFSPHSQSGLSSYIRCISRLLIIPS